MADIAVKKEPRDAEVAYRMAMSLWGQEFDRHPKATDSKFLALVSLCVQALRGRTPSEKLENSCKEIFPEQSFPAVD